MATLENCFQDQGKMALLWWQFVISTRFCSPIHWFHMNWIHVFFNILRGAIYYLSCFFLFYKYIEAWNWFWESLKGSKLIPALLNPSDPHFRCCLIWKHIAALIFLLMVCAEIHIFVLRKFCKLWGPSGRQTFNPCFLEQRWSRSGLCKNAAQLCWPLITRTLQWDFFSWPK